MCQPKKSQLTRMRDGGRRFVLSVTSTPQKIDDALTASLRTLRSVATQRVSQRELDRARRLLLTRHDSDLRDNTHLLALLSHTQCDAVPRKTLKCIHDLPGMYELATIEDVYAAYAGLALDDASLFSCVGVSGTEAPVVKPVAASAAGRPGAAADAYAALASAMRKAGGAGVANAASDESMAASAAMAAAAVMKAFKANGGLEGMGNAESGTKEDETKK
jgi:hypothetical protein